MSTPLGRFEERAPREFFLRLKQPDAITVKAIVATVTSLATEYNDEKKMMSRFHNTFFAVYGIAGNVTKFGDRPDVDLLVATNSVSMSGYYFEDDASVSDIERKALGGDPVAGRLYDTFNKEDYKVTVTKDIPNRYTKVGANKKGMLRLEPNSKGRKPIDIVIVNNTSLKEYEVETKEDFERLVDIDPKTGETLSEGFIVQHIIILFGFRDGNDTQSAVPTR